MQFCTDDDDDDDDDASKNVARIACWISLDALIMICC